MALFVAGLPIELREIVLRNKPDSMLKASPKGTVPVLILENSTVIDESLDIMKWALNENDPDNWLSANKEQTDMLIGRNDNDFKKALDRYKYPSRYPDEDCAWAKSGCEAIYKDLNERIKSNGYLCDDKITLADIAIFPFIRQSAHVDKEWFYDLPYTHLQKWLDEHLASHLFLSIMKKLPPWEEGDTPLMLSKLMV